MLYTIITEGVVCLTVAIMSLQPCCRSGKGMCMCGETQVQDLTSTQLPSHLCWCQNWIRTLSQQCCETALSPCMRGSGTSEVPHSFIRLTMDDSVLSVRWFCMCERLPLAECFRCAEAQLYCSALVGRALCRSCPRSRCASTEIPQEKSLESMLASDCLSMCMVLDRFYYS